MNCNCKNNNIKLQILKFVYYFKNEKHHKKQTQIYANFEVILFV
jgi:hypothetical protein